MILEHAWLTVMPGREDDFMTAITAALDILTSAPNCQGAEVRRQIEDPSTFLLLVQWTSVEDHMGFRASDTFATWRSLTAPFYGSPAVVTHFSQALERPPG